MPVLGDAGTARNRARPSPFRPKPVLIGDAAVTAVLPASRSLDTAPAMGGLAPALAEALRALLGSRFSTSLAEREHHGRGESYHASRPPDAVCRAQSTDEVAAVVRLCAQHETPVIAFGAGTSLEGHIAALHGGVSLDLAGMTRILAIRPGDFDATVEAGVTRQQLDAALRDVGLFFPVDPGAECTLGGMAATRASGTNAVRYGTMRENVVTLTVVMADGRIIKTGGRARKSSAGYDLTRLFVGSEGTLGIITEVTLRLHPLPEAVSALVCSFATVADAVEAVTVVIQCAVPVARVELVDARAIAAVNRHSKLELAETPTLFFELHGSPAEVEQQARTVEGIVGEHGATHLAWATDPDERRRLWRARHNIHYALQAMRPDARIWSTDVCVPISQLAPCLAATQADIEAASFYIGTVGHVGDGNFHLGLVIDPNSPTELAEAKRLNERLIERAIACDGTCTGEHGIGYGKAQFMEREHGEAVDVMRAIKQALDPLGILNPGKVLPAAGS
jgi:D-lactate dehydrogenase (cytochrome)